MTDLIKAYQTLASAPLTDAHSLPFEVYHDEGVYQLEVEKIFHNEWIFICAEKQLSEIGDYCALDLAGEAIVVLRGKDGVLRGLSNNCRHRGTQLLDNGFGNISKTITCPYHAWAYDTEGSFIGAPFPGNIRLEKSEHCLPKFQLDTWMGLVFVNLSSNSAPISNQFDGIEDFARIFEPEKFDIALPGEEEHWDTNWKLVMENAMESYHLFQVHKDTLEVYSPTKQSYYVAGSADWTLTGGQMLDKAGAIAKWFRGDYPDSYNHYLLISLPPAFVGIMTYDSFGWIHVLPKDSQTSIIRSGAMARLSYGSEDKQSQDFTAAFFAEDKWICERVQKGMYSKQGRGGKLVEMERVVVDFHQYLASRLFGAKTDKFYDDSNSTVFNTGAG